MIRILLILCLSLSVQAKEYKEIYLNVAGPVNGPGVKGHAFITFSQYSWGFSDSETYQYGMDFEKIPAHLKEQGSLTPTRVLELAHAANNLPIAIDYLHSRSFIQKYQDENRAVLSLRLNLTKDEIAQIYQKIKADYDSFEKGELGSGDSFEDRYQLIKSNCATLLLRKVGEVLEKTRGDKNPFKSLFDSKGSLEWKNALDKKALLGTLPLFWSSLYRDSELVKEKRIFKATDAENLEYLSKINVKLYSVFKSCGKTGLVSAYTRILGNPELRENEKLLSHYVNNLESCKKSADKVDFEELVSLSIALTRRADLFLKVL